MFRAILIAGLFLALGGGTVRADVINLLTNGDFETPRINAPFVTYLDGSTAITGWTVGSRNEANTGVDLIGTYWNGVSNTVGDQSVDIDFDSTLSQAFATVIGRTYDLSFYYSHNSESPTNSSTGFATVLGNGGSTLLSTGNLTHSISNTTANMQWIQYTGTFVADSSLTTLRFSGVNDNQGYGWAVDNASVVAQGGAAVPEPTTIVLAGLGLCGMGYRARRKMKV